MIQVIKRFIIKPEEPSILKLPKSAIFLNALPNKDKEIIIFVLTSDNKKLTQFEVHCIDVGGTIEGEYQYLNTVQLHRGVFEFSVFIKEKQHGDT